MKLETRANPLRWVGLLIIILSITALGCLSSAGFETATPPPATPAAVVSPPAVNQPSSALPAISMGASDTETRLISLYNQVNPSIVHIRIYADGFLLGSGSGFLVDDQRHIVTNNHVVQEAEQIEVVWWDATRTRGQVIGSDADADLAVLLVDTVPDSVAPLVMGDSSALQVGQQVIAIGNPFGLQGTMTVGIISGLGRRLDSQRVLDPNVPGTYSNPDIIQTDAAINPGNSGGPLLNSAGEMIGINTAIRSSSGTSSGVGFAAPVNTIKKLLPHLIEEGSYTYSWMGVTGRTEIDLFTMEELGLPQSQGVLVTDVTRNGPSDQAGIRQGDFIIQIDGKPLADFSDLISYLVAATEPGQVVELAVLRNGERLDVSVTLGERP